MTENEIENNEIESLIRDDPITHARYYINIIFFL
jgi:hypothetical protein